MMDVLMKISHEITLCIPLILIVEISDIEINNDGIGLYEYWGSK